MLISTNNNNMLPIAKNIPPLINLLFSLSTSWRAILTCKSITELAIAEILEAVFAKFLFFGFSILFSTIAQQTLEAAKGSIDDLVEVIASHSGTSVIGIKSQLFEIIDSIRENNWEISEKIEPIESQLEEL